MSKGRIVSYFIACVLGALLMQLFQWGCSEKLRIDLSNMEQKKLACERSLDWAVKRGIRAESMWMLCRQGHETPAR